MGSSGTQEEASEVVVLVVCFKARPGLEVVVEVVEVVVVAKQSPYYITSEIRALIPDQVVFSHTHPVARRP